MFVSGLSQRALVAGRSPGAGRGGRLCPRPGCAAQQVFLGVLNHRVLTAAGGRLAGQPWLWPCCMAPGLPAPGQEERSPASRDKDVFMAELFCSLY